MRNKSLFLVISFFLTFSFFSCSKTHKQEHKEKFNAVSLKKKTLIQDNIYKVEIKSSATLGPKNAPVTIINFSDFECPFSERLKRFMSNTLKKYNDKIQYVFKNSPLPFHRMAEPSARAALAAKMQGKFWEMYNKLYENQKNLTNENFEKWAKEIGLDVEKFKKDMYGEEVNKELKTEKKQALQFGVKGTPTVFINGFRIVGANTPLIEKTIKEQIVIGERLKLKGIKNVYETIIASGKTSYTLPKRKAPKIPQDIFNIEIPKTAPTLGNPDAPITLVLFDDFECSFCQRLFYEFQTLLREYKDTINIRFINYPLDFHPKAKTIAKIAISAQQQGKFKEMYEFLFKNRTKWREAKDLNIFLKKNLKKLGINEEKFFKDLDSAKVLGKLNKDIALAKKTGIQGTPTIFVNGRLVAGAYPIDSFKNVIEQELKRAKPFMQKGLKGEELYKELVKNGFKSIPELIRSKQALPHKHKAKIYKIPLTGNEPVLGNKNAKITIIEFSDFECPFCKRGEKVVKQAIKELGFSTKLIFKNMPLPSHKNAKDAALFAIAVKESSNSKKFFEISDKLFNNYEKWRKNPQEFFKKYATESKLNWQKIQKIISSGKAEKILKQDTTLAGELELKNVPVFFINGRKINGALPISAFKEIIKKIVAQEKKDGNKSN